MLMRDTFEERTTVDCGLWISDCGLENENPQSAIDNPQSAIGNPQSAIRNPIDNFILARLEKEGLTPAPEASKDVVLVLRAT